MRMREMMTNAATWLAESMPAPHERPGSDESIRRALIAELRSQGWCDPDHCHVMVHDGIVQIAGSAVSAQERIAARAAAVRIPGVRAFNDGRSYCVPGGRNP